jgi:hypothetical protein
MWLNLSKAKAEIAGFQKETPQYKVENGIVLSQLQSFYLIQIRLINILRTFDSKRVFLNKTLIFVKNLFIT